LGRLGVIDKREGLHRLSLLLGSLLALPLSSTACAGDGDDLPPPPSAPAEQLSASTAPTLDERTAEAWEEIQGKFDGFMETWIKWAAQGRPGGFVDPATAELNEYAEFRIRDEAVAALTRESRDGLVREGRPRWYGERLLSVDWDREVQDHAVPEAIFEVCVDDREWTLVDEETREPVQADVVGSHLWTVTAWWFEDREVGPDGWALSQREVDRSEAC
jgi:hypothetical protein